MINKYWRKDAEYRLFFKEVLTKGSFVPSPVFLKGYLVMVVVWVGVGVIVSF